jgi:LCP family protein required for cell wall assembly
MNPPEEGGRPPERPDYKVYRSRRGLLSRFRKPDLQALREKTKGPSRPGRERGPKPERAPGETSTARRVAKWVGIAALVWIGISILAFAISAQIQKGKLAPGITDTLDGNPFLAAIPQNILVLGTDIRSGAFASEEQASSKKCLEQIGGGRGSDESCPLGPFRSDTIMVIRAGGGTFRKLSIPRDTLADIPDHGPDKINSAYAIGGAGLTVKTVEGLLGIDIDQVAIIDFDGFRNFIDTIGGVTVDLPKPVCSVVSGGAFKLDLSAGEHTLNGFQAITLARTRTSGDCDGDGAIDDPSLSDVDRTQFQQLILDGIKDRLTSVTRIPYNFIKGPFIAWDAPKVMVSSMGAWTMPQLAVAAGIGGNDGSFVMKPTSTTAAGNSVISPEDCEKAARQLMGGDPPREPNCPQG